VPAALASAALVPAALASAPAALASARSHHPPHHAFFQKRIRLGRRGFHGRIIFIIIALRVRSRGIIRRTNERPHSIAAAHTPCIFFCTPCMPLCTLMDSSAFHLYIINLKKYINLLSLYIYKFML
jgi:hypothetical protein